MLGTLSCYLQAASEWMSGLAKADRGSLARPQNELPHYMDAESRIFPFRHTQLWADSTPSELERVAEEYGAIVKLVAGSCVH
jgi:hypothetical protein